MDLNLRDKVAVVTGGGSGIGRGIALGFAEELAHVVIADINLEKALRIEHEIGVRFSDVTCLASEVDVTCERSVKHLVQQAVDRFGAVHILVNNVGVTLPSFIEKVKEKDRL